MAANGWSKTWTFYDGDWHEGNVRIVGPRTHALWLASSVFDGARAFEGVTPDLDRHCARVNASAPKRWGSSRSSTRKRWLGLTRDGMKRFAQEHAALYPPDVLGGAGRLPVRRAARPGLDALSALPLRDADAAAERPVSRHAVAVSPADHRMHADRRQGGLPLSEQRARASSRRVRAASTTAWSATCSAMSRRPATSNIFMVKDGVVLHAGRERHVPRRHHAPAHHRAVARCRRDRGRETSLPLCGLRSTRMRFSPPATTPRWCPSRASRIASCSPGRSIARRASSTGTGRTAPDPEGAQWETS